jgi:hypothetical protein
VSTQDPNDLRDPRLDAAWRAASNEEPPAALDDAIRASARREVNAGPQPARTEVTSVPLALRPERWWMPLAAAATIGAIAIGILQLANTDKLVEPVHDKAVVSDMPSTPSMPSSTIQTAPTPAPQPPAAADDTRNRAAAPPPVSSPVAEEKAAPTLRKDTASKFATEERAMKPEALAPATPSGGGRQAGAIDAAKPAAPFAEPFPADSVKREAKESTAAPPPASPASMPAEQPVAGVTANKQKSVPVPSARDEASLEQQRANASVAQAPAPAAQAPMRRMQEAEAGRSGTLKNDAATSAAGASLDARAKVQPKLAVADWITLIRKLRDEGKSDDVAKELAAFRAAYPDHERLLPPDLRDWNPAEH